MVIKTHPCKTKMTQGLLKMLLVASYVEMVVILQAVLVGLLQFVVMLIKMQVERWMVIITHPYMKAMTKGVWMSVMVLKVIMKRDEKGAT